MKMNYLIKVPRKLKNNKINSNPNIYILRMLQKINKKGKMIKVIRQMQKVDHKYNKKLKKDRKK